MVSTTFADILLELSPEDAQSIFVDQNTNIQIVDTVSMLPSADKEQCGAFIVS